MNMITYALILGSILCLGLFCVFWTSAIVQWWWSKMDDSKPGINWVRRFLHGWARDEEGEDYRGELYTSSKCPKCTDRFDCGTGCNHISIEDSTRRLVAAHALAAIAPTTLYLAWSVYPLTLSIGLFVLISFAIRGIRRLSKKLKAHEENKDAHK